MKKRNTMKKVVAKVVGVTLATVMVAGCLIGCGAGGNGGGAKSNGKSIQIYAQTNGLGQDWLNNAAKAYRDKTGTEVNVLFDAYISTNIRPTFEAEKAEIADLYFIQTGEWRSLFTDGYLEDLTDLMETKGDAGKSLNERMTVDKTWIWNDAGEESQVYVPVTKAPTGIVYNKQMMKVLCQDILGWEEGHDYPVNTKELKEVIEALKNINEKGDNKDLFTYNQNGKKMDVKPLVWSGSTGMLEFFTNAWLDQYWGEKGWEAFYNQYDNCDLLNDKGLYLVYQTMVDILGLEEDSNGEWISSTSVPNCVSYNHTSAQSQLLMNHAVMCPTGSWFYSEMKSTIEDVDNLGFMPVPYLSDDDGNPVTNEGVEMPKTEDGEYANYSRLNTADFFVIPAKASDENKEEAKAFLQFIFSEEYMPTLQTDLQAPLCFEFDDSTVEKTAWLKEVDAFVDKTTNVKSWFGTKTQVYGKIGLYNNPTEAPFSRLSISGFGSSKKLVDSATGKEINSKEAATGIAVTENVYNYVFNNYKAAAGAWPSTKEWLERH